MPCFQIGISLGPLGAIPATALDHNITAIGDIPQPPIMGNVDPSKIDEIRRTVYVGNLNSQVNVLAIMNALMESVSLYFMA